MRRRASFVTYINAAVQAAAGNRSRRNTLFGVWARLFMGFACLLAASRVSAQSITGPGNTIPWDGQNLYVAGANVPWYNYSTDFGTGGWGKYTDFNSINSLFATMNKQKVKAVRWFIFGDGRYSPEFNASGTVTGLDSQFMNDVDTALRIAHDNHIYLIPCLVDFYMFNSPQSAGGVTGGGHSALATNSTVRQSYLDNALKPLLQHVAASPYKSSVLAYDIANEPEFSTNGIAGSAVSLAQMQTFVKSCASYIHAYGGGAYATMGSGADYWVRNWVGLGLDFYQIHWYPNFTGQSLSTYASLKLDRPCIVGEFPTSDYDQACGSTTYFSAQWFLDTIYNQGYAGALGWAAYTVDDQSNWNGFAPVFTTWLNNQGKTPNGAASFVKVDTKTQGKWKGVYGSEGYNVLSNAYNYPTYVSYLIASGQLPYTWADPASEQTALQKVSANSGNLAACAYTFNALAVDVNTTDNNYHQVALYCLDYDQKQRTQTIDVVDAISNKVLDSRTLSGFQNGTYIVWKVKGYVRFRFTNLSITGVTAVMSGLFIDSGISAQAVAANSATFVNADTTTSGNWKSKYGKDGYHIISQAASFPGYADVIGNDTLSYTWAASSTNTLALQKAGVASDRILSCWYSFTNLGTDVNLTDGQTHQVSLYCVDYANYDGTLRKQTVDVLDADTGAVLNTQTLTNFTGGAYLVWNIKGHVKFRVTNKGTTTAVLSGMFFDVAAPVPGSNAASFVKTDTSSQGTWKGKYGSAGYSVIGNATTYPTYTAVSPSGTTPYTWVASTSSVLGLQKTGTSADRLLSCWYSYTNFLTDVNLKDGQTHQVSLYCVDYANYDGTLRKQTVDVLDADTGAVLNTQTLTNFTGGAYLVWNIKGHVKFRVTNKGTTTAVLSGMFFD